MCTVSFHYVHHQTAVFVPPNSTRVNVAPTLHDCHMERMSSVPFHLPTVAVHCRFARDWQAGMAEIFHGPIAQLAEAYGHGFESCRRHHKKRPPAAKPRMR